MLLKNEDKIQEINILIPSYLISSEYLRNKMKRSLKKCMVVN